MSVDKEDIKFLKALNTRIKRLEKKKKTKSNLANKRVRKIKLPNIYRKRISVRLRRVE